MNHLVPCPSCARHVRQSEVACPFCSAPLSLADVPAPVLPRGRLGRAATFAFGASLVGATSLVACGGESEEGKGGGGTTNTAGTMSSGGTGAPMPVYGAPAAGTGGDSSFAGSAIAPMYGGAAAIGGSGPVYGAPPGGMNSGGAAGSGGDGGSGGTSDNANGGTGGPNVGPVYGTPPIPPQD